MYDSAKRQPLVRRVRRKQAGHAAPVELVRIHALGDYERDGRGGKHTGRTRSRWAEAADSAVRQAHAGADAAPRRRTGGVWHALAWTRTRRAYTQREGGLPRPLPLHTQGRGPAVSYIPAHPLSRESCSRDVQCTLPRPAVDVRCKAVDGAMTCTRESVSAASIKPWANVLQKVI